MAALPQSGWILASLLFIFARTGFGCSLIFYDALLPHFARPEDIDRVSTYGYALGYLGGAVLLAVNLPVLIDPAVLGFSDASWPARLSFVSVGVWWIAWSIPLFKAVPEPAAGVSDVQGHWLTSGFVQLWHTLKKLPRYREVLKFLIAFWLYIDGVATIISSATIYGSTLKLDTGALITALLITQVVGIPCAIGFGYLARWTGAKGGILLAIGVYIVITIFAFFLDSEAEFYALAIAVGFVQGGIQALSRSLFASIVPKHLSGEFFGFFSTFSKFAAFLGPLLVASVTSISTALGAQSAGPNGIIALIPLFVVGGLLLWRVDVDAAKAQAAAEDAAIAQSETAANAPSAQP
jgi:UMF1 family MFS transporter